MVRASFAAACCLVSLLALSGTARAEQPCSGIAITDVIETARGELTSVGERCYEREPGLPFYYDAPGNRSGIGVPEQPVGASVTRVDATAIQALGAQDISELVDPFSGDRSRFIYRPDRDQHD